MIDRMIRFLAKKQLSELQQQLELEQKSAASKSALIASLLDKNDVMIIQAPDTMVSQCFFGEGKRLVILAPATRCVINGCNFV